jgi:molecular chaperone GrpE (heat shock protein)
MKKFVLVPLLILFALAASIPLCAKDDFLNTEEIARIRDAEDAGKRVLLYLEFAQKRLDAAREKTISWKEAGSGAAIQKNLSDYNSIFDALDDALEMARQQRAPLAKPLKELETQGNHFLKVLEQLKNAPIRSDYQFTLDEAVEMTQDELGEVKKGAYPEVNERKPPTDLPAAPPPPSKNPGDEEGPPRKKSRGSSNTP